MKGYKRWWEKVKALPAPRLDEAFSGGFYFQDFTPSVRIDFTKILGRGKPKLPK